MQQGGCLRSIPVPSLEGQSTAAWGQVAGWAEVPGSSHSLRTPMPRYWDTAGNRPPAQGVHSDGRDDVCDITTQCAVGREHREGASRGLVGVEGRPGGQELAG